MATLRCIKAIIGSALALAATFHAAFSQTPVNLGLYTHDISVHLTTGFMYQGADEARYVAVSNSRGYFYWQTRFHATLIHQWSETGAYLGTVMSPTRPILPTGAGNYNNAAVFLDERGVFYPYDFDGDDTTARCYGYQYHPYATAIARTRNCIWVGDSLGKVTVYLLESRPVRTPDQPLEPPLPHAGPLTLTPGGIITVMRASPRTDRDWVFVGTRDGRMYTLEYDTTSQTIRVIGKSHSHLFPVAEIVHTSNRVAVGTQDGYVHVYRLDASGTTTPEYVIKDIRGSLLPNQISAYEDAATGAQYLCLANQPNIRIYRLDTGGNLVGLYGIPNASDAYGYTGTLFDVGYTVLIPQLIRPRLAAARESWRDAYGFFSILGDMRQASYLRFPRPDGRSSPVYALSVSPSGRYLAIGYADGHLAIRDLFAGGAVVAWHRPVRQPVFSVDWALLPNADEVLLASAGLSGVYKYESTTNFAPPATSLVPNDTHAYYGLSVVRVNGFQIVFVLGGTDRRLRYYSVFAGATNATLITQYSTGGYVYDVLSRNGRIVVAHSNGSSAAELLADYTLRNAVNFPSNTIALHPDGHVAAWRQIHVPPARLAYSFTQQQERYADWGMVGPGGNWGGYWSYDMTFARSRQPVLLESFWAGLVHARDNFSVDGLDNPVYDSTNRQHPAYFSVTDIYQPSITSDAPIYCIDSALDGRIIVGNFAGEVIMFTRLGRPLATARRRHVFAVNFNPVSGGIVTNELLDIDRGDRAYCIDRVFSGAVHTALHPENPRECLIVDSNSLYRWQHDRSIYQREILPIYDPRWYQAYSRLSPNGKYFLYALGVQYDANTQVYSVYIQMRKYLDSLFNTAYPLTISHSNYPHYMVGEYGVCYDGEGTVAVAVPGHKVRLYEFDRSSNTWSFTSELPTPLPVESYRHSLHFIIDDSRLLAVRYLDWSTRSWILQIWKQQSGNWVQIANLPSDNASAYAYDSKVLSDVTILLAVGGRNGVKFYKFDLRTDSFTEIGDATALATGLKIHDAYWIRFSPDGSMIGIANLGGFYAVYGLPRELQ